MKGFKVFSLALFVGLIPVSTYSQLSIGGQATYLHLFGGTGIKTIGLGPKVDYTMDYTNVFMGSLSVYMPSKLTGTVYGNAFSSATDPSQIEIDATWSLKFFHLAAGVRRYFVGDYEEDFGFYGLLELGAMLIPAKTTVAPYDTSLYWVMEEDLSNQTFFNFLLTGGVGTEVNLDFAYLFGDLKLNIPANKVGGATVAVQIPASFTLSAGLRVPLY